MTTQNRTAFCASERSRNLPGEIGHPDCSISRKLYGAIATAPSKAPAYKTVNFAQVIAFTLREGG